MKGSDLLLFIQGTRTLRSCLFRSTKTTGAVATTKYTQENYGINWIFEEFLKVSIMSQ